MYVKRQIQDPKRFYWMVANPFICSRFVRSTCKPMCNNGLCMACTSARMCFYDEIKLDEIILIIPANGFRFSIVKWKSGKSTEDCQIR